MERGMMITNEALVNEGVRDAIEHAVTLARLQSVTVTPTVFRETGSRSDRRLPPLDVDGSARLLERPLHGKDELYGTFALPFQVREEFYGSSPYRPKIDTDLTDTAAEAIEIVREIGLRANLAISPFRVPGLAKDDYARDAHDRPVAPAISVHACPNNPHAGDFAEGLVLSMADRYRPDGIKCDWLEYTNYFLEDNLVCFCPHCREKATAWGFDFSAMRSAVDDFYSWVAGAKPEDARPRGGWSQTWTEMSPGILKLFEFKARTVEAIAARLRGALDERGFRDTVLYAPGFAVPMNVGTGLDYGKLSQLSDRIVVQSKMYRFHWGLMVGWYAGALERLNKKGVSAESWVPFVTSMLELEDDASPTLDRFLMPSADERCPVTLGTEQRKSEQMVHSTGPDVGMLRVHAYGRLDVFEERLRNASLLALRGIEIQRYGYCADEKLEALGRVFGEGHE